MKEKKLKLEIIKDRSVTPADDLHIRKLLADCFPDERAIFLKCRKWHSDPEYILVSRKARKPIGHVAIIVREIACGRVKIKVAGIQSLAVGPELRGRGLSQALMTESMAEAWRRGIEFGLLFCVPELERFYASLGWKRVEAPVHILGESGRKEKLPAKNIAMHLRLSDRLFPPGTIDLLGCDW